MEKEPLTTSLVDWGVAARALAGESESGDWHLVEPFPGGLLIAVVDGLGHGHEAAVAAERAVSTLKRHAQEPLIPLVRRCHYELSGTRGVAMSLATLDAREGTMTWLGVGNVQGVLMRTDPTADPAHDWIPLRGGVVGYQLPPLRATLLTLTPSDTLILVTDGIHSGFTEEMTVSGPPQETADRILARDAKGSDDALVLVARYRGGLP